MSQLNKEQQREREARVWKLRNIGYTHERIADEIGVDKSTITKMLQRLSLKASKALITEVVEEKYAQIGMLRHVVEESFDGWERSKQSAKVMTTRTPTRQAGEGAPAAKPTDATVRVSDQDGDTRYLTEARAALADIRKLMGLDSPSKLMSINLDSLTDEQLQRIANGEDPMIVVMGL
jgi:hypothetical protein